MLATAVGGVLPLAISEATPVAAAPADRSNKKPQYLALGTNIIEKSLWESGGAIYAAGRPSNF